MQRDLLSASRTLAITFSIWTAPQAARSGCDSTRASLRTGRIVDNHVYGELMIGERQIEHKQIA